MSVKTSLVSILILTATVYAIHAQSTVQYGIDFTSVTCTARCYQSKGAFIDGSGNISGQAIIGEGSLIAQAGGPYPGQPNSLVRFNGIAPAGTQTISSFSGINAPAGVSGPAQTWLEVADTNGNKYYIPAFSLATNAAR